MNKGGRPAFAPTKAQREKVMICKAAGMSEAAIAAALGISDETLRKYFACELNEGHSRKLAENLARLEAAAKKGNVAAMKYLDGRLQTVPLKQSRPKPGKKETLAAEARDGHRDTDWSDLLN